MKENTLGGLQELGRLLKKVKSCRCLTEQEIKDFPLIPEGAVLYSDYESYQKALSKVNWENRVETGGNHPGIGGFWIKGG